MAATISANPNPVLFPSPDLGPSSGSTRITWDTGASNINGKVTLSVNGASETLFDTRRKVTNKLYSPVQFGKTLVFRLRQVPGDSLLASVTVTTGKTAGLPTVVIETNDLAGGYSQGIFNLTVSPGVDAVTITFRTRQPTNPFVKIINQDTGKLHVWWKRPDKRTVHRLNMLSEDFSPLAQNAKHSYEIIAEAMPGSPDTTKALLSGTFRTGSRTAEIFFDRIHVRNDGDSGFLGGAGEFRFNFGAGDVATEESLENVEHWGEGDIHAGGDADVNRVVTIPTAPRGLWVQVNATEDDGFCTVGYVPSFAPPGSSAKETEACVIARVTEHFDISQTLGGTSETPFEMHTGNFAIAYDVFGRLRVEAHAGSGPELPVVRRPLPYAQTVSAVGWVSPKKNVTAIRKQGGAQRLVLGPDGAVYHHALAEDPRAEDSWTNLGGRFEGAVTMVATGPERVILFGLSPEGAVLYKTHAPDARSGDDWQTLGGAFVGRIVAAVGANGAIALFARGEDGSVSHRTLSERGEPQSEWEPIGHGIADSMATLFSFRTGLSLFALGRGGEVLYKRRPLNEEWRPVGREWESLGVASDGLLSAEWVGDEALLLAVVAEDETVRVLAWPGYPDPPPPEGWQIVGTVNSLLQGRVA